MCTSRKNVQRTAPIIFTTVVIMYVFTTFMVFVVLPMLETVEQYDTGLTYAIAMGSLFCFLMASFLRVSMADPGEIPNWFADNASPNSKLKAKTVEQKSDGTRRYCNKCQLYKPDRTHHCRVCGRCNLKMDHHCPWINNCVGSQNYKFFLLFITYSLASAIFVFVVTLTTLPGLSDTISSESRTIILSDCIITGALSLALSAFVGFHFYLLVCNYTTIEFVEKRGCGGGQGHVNVYDLGAWENMKRTMGSNILLWPFPVSPSSDPNDGTFFETNETLKSKSAK
eukprot:c7234_g1_i1.p1 GENE.c7234_g1_i1~~c7234_g1_i1.p1  ORF type:complete len:283 (+),score=80.70 c7234_g1_i1:91-939(+)